MRVKAAHAHFKWGRRNVFNKKKILTQDQQKPPFHGHESGNVVPLIKRIRKHHGYNKDKILLYILELSHHVQETNC